MEQRSARVTMPLARASLSAQKKKTSPLSINPPQVGRYLYWDNRQSGHRLEFKKRDPAAKKGWRYLYMGFWSRADMIALLTELDTGDALKVLRAEANRNAGLYLKRKKEKENE